MGVHLLQLAAHLDELVPLRCFVEEKTTDLQIAADKIHDILLSVDELVTNIILHGYRGREGSIEIQLELQGDSLIVFLRDQAPLFDPTQVPPPDITLPLEKRPIGGMGIHLARHLMDEMQYRVTSSGGNELILVKRNVLPYKAQRLE